MKYQYGQERKRQNSTEIIFLLSKTQKNIHFYIEVDVFRENGITSFRPYRPCPCRPCQALLRAFGSGLSATTASVVKNIAATDAAF